jgi:hypothetical protein
MNRAEREAMIAKLEMENAAMLVDMAERKAARELNGDYDPIVSNSASTPNFDVEAAIRDQIYQRKSYVQPQPQQPEEQLVTLGCLASHADALIDATVEHVAEMIAPLQKRIADLEAKISLITNIATGNIKMIEGKRNNVA